MAPSKVPIAIHEDKNYMKQINNMALTVPKETHNMATKIEDEPLPWYLVNTVIDTDIGDILKYKDITQ